MLEDSVAAVAEPWADPQLPMCPNSPEHNSMGQRSSPKPGTLFPDFSSGVRSKIRSKLPGLRLLLHAEGDKWEEEKMGPHQQPVVSACYPAPTWALLTPPLHTSKTPRNA